MHKNIQNMGKLFTLFEKGTVKHAAIACMKGLKYTAQNIKCINFT